MPEIKLILTDLDGTVVPLFSNEVSDRVHSAVVAAEKRGVCVTPITGRPYEMAQPLLDRLGFNDLCIPDNGASIRQVIGGALMWSQWLEAEKIKEILKAMMADCILVDYETGWKEHSPVKGEIEFVTQPASHVYGAVKDSSIEQVMARLAAIDGVTAFNAPGKLAGQRGVQVNHHQADKFHGAAALHKLTGIPKENTLAIGDGDNDLPLFQHAAIKVAMGNATDNLKAAADYVVGSVEQDGFAEAVERFIINKDY